MGARVDYTIVTTFSCKEIPIKVGTVDAPTTEKENNDMNNTSDKTNTMDSQNNVDNSTTNSMNHTDMTNTTATANS